jgi:DnaD/phage-associated family protein
VSYLLNLPGMFAVPNAVVDEHLKLARELHLKTLLWLLRRGGEAEGFAALAHWLGKPEGDVVDALQFWIDKGVIRTGETQAQENAPAPVAVPASPSPAPRPVPSAGPPARPTNEQLLARLDEQPDLRSLFRTADSVLGRTIGYEGQCVLLGLYDNYGLPVEVIFMLLQYCAEIEKTNNQYIESVGRDWGQREIDTIDKAADQIAALKDNMAAWRQLRRLAGLHAPKPTAAQCDYLRRWQREWNFGVDMIFMAYEEMANHTGKLSFSYMNKVLETWHSAGVATPEQAAAAKAARGKQPAGKKSKSSAVSQGYAPSFDLEAFERSTLEVPVFSAGEKH